MFGANRKRGAVLEHENIFFILVSGPTLKLDASKICTFGYSLNIPIILVTLDIEKFFKLLSPLNDR